MGLPENGSSLLNLQMAIEKRKHADSPVDGMEFLPFSVKPWDGSSMISSGDRG